MKTPAEGQIAFIHGGVAQYRSGYFYTGMEDPRWERKILWTVKWWWPININPLDADALERFRDTVMGHSLGSVGV